MQSILQKLGCGLSELWEQFQHPGPSLVDDPPRPSWHKEPVLRPTAKCAADDLVGIQPPRRNPLETMIVEPLRVRPRLWLSSNRKEQSQTRIWADPPDRNAPEAYPVLNFCVCPIAIGGGVRMSKWNLTGSAAPGFPPGEDVQDHRRWTTQHYARYSPEIRHSGDTPCHCTQVNCSRNPACVRIKRWT